MSEEEQAPIEQESIEKPTAKITQKKISERKAQACAKARQAKSDKLKASKTKKEITSKLSIVLVSIGVLAGIVFLLRKKKDKVVEMFTGAFNRKEILPPQEKSLEEKLTKTDLLRMIEELTERIIKPKEDEVTPEEVEEIKETPSEEPKEERVELKLTYA